MDLIDRELLEIGYKLIDTFIYKYNNVLIKRFDLGLIEISKDDKIVFEGLVSKVENLKIILSAVGVPQDSFCFPNRHSDYHYKNTEKYYIKKGDIIELFTNEGYNLIQLPDDVNHYPNQGYIYTYFHNYYDRELKYSDFNVITREELKVRKTLVRGKIIKDDSFMVKTKDSIYKIKSIIHNTHLGGCTINGIKKNYKDIKIIKFTETNKI